MPEHSPVSRTRRLALACVGFEPVLMALHHAGTAFFVRAFSALVMFASAYVLTVRIGAVGAAIGFLIGTATAEFLLAFVTARAVRQSSEQLNNEGMCSGATCAPPRSRHMPAAFD